MSAVARRLKANIEGLFPGYFAMVMATGILAVASKQQNLGLLADALYAISVVSYAVLSVLLVARLVIASTRLVEDITSHARGFAFLTTVAATNVLASASALVRGWWTMAWVLWCFSLVLWGICMYTTLIAVVLKAPKPGLEKGINGTWFLMTVATESIAVAGALLLPKHQSDALAFGLLAAFVLGLVLYLIVTTLVFLRWTFHTLDPTEVDPPAWIAAGAVAITVLAGSNLLVASEVSPRLDRVGPFVEGIVVLAWATATFWFPLMVAIGVWRHVVNRVPLRYHPSYWALIFPLGMYAASTFRMRAAVWLGALDWLPKVTLVIAMAAWTAAFVGLAVQAARALRTSPDPTEPDTS